MLDRIRKKSTLVLLIGIFAVMIVLMVAMTQHSVSQLNHAQARLDTIVTIHNTKRALTDKIQHVHRERLVVLQQMFLVDGRADAEIAADKHRSLEKQLAGARKALAAMPQNSTETALLERLDRAFVAAEPVNTVVRGLLSSKYASNRAHAYGILTADMLPLQSRFDAIFTELSQLYEQAIANAVQASAEQHETSRWVTLTMLKLTVLMSIIAGAAATLLIRRDRKSLEKHRDTLEVLVQDRTAELQRISHEATQARREAEEASNAKSTFLANMSHELRTPLNAVLGFSDVMEHQLLGPLPDAYRDYPSHISTSARHLLQMIQQLLDMSRIEAGRVEVSEERVCLRSLMDEATTIVRSAFSRDEETLRFDPASDRAAIHGDSQLLKQTLINILSNAAKYSGRDEPIDVAVQIMESGDVMLTVQDRGIGIAAEEIPRLFNPYERSSAQTARQKQGTGLGLAIAKSLIEAHGGTLALESALGKGTVVTITLPAKRVLEAHIMRSEECAA